MEVSPDLSPALSLQGLLVGQLLRGLDAFPDISRATSVAPAISGTRAGPCGQSRGPQSSRGPHHPPPCNGF